jgi:hypothetical protein
VDALVVGVDFALSYRRLSVAAETVRRGALFVATNRDANYPTADGLTAGAGAIVAAVEVAGARGQRGADERLNRERRVNPLGLQRRRHIRERDLDELDLGGIGAGLLERVADRDLRKVLERVDRDLLALELREVGDAALGCQQRVPALSSLEAAAIGLSGRFCAMPFMIDLTFEKPI